MAPHHSIASARSLPEGIRDVLEFQGRFRGGIVVLDISSGPGRLSIVVEWTDARLDGESRAP
jgi:hypothetical protein